MDSGTPPKISYVYEDFEPYCKWKREQLQDTIEVDLQGFKKDQLKVRLMNAGNLSVTGERKIDDKKAIRFQKDFTVPKDCKTDEIRAKLAGGFLSITMPKRTPLPTAPAPAPAQDPGNVAWKNATTRQMIIILVALLVAISALPLMCKKYCCHLACNVEN